MSNVFFLSEASKRSKEGCKIFSIRDLQSKIDPIILKNILCLHAWSGCDITSATLGFGKGAILKKMKNNSKLRDICQIFYNQNATHIDIAYAGERIFIILYGGKHRDDLGKLRHNIYMKQVSTSKSKIRPEILPPTKSAAEFHSYRVYLQVMQWSRFHSIGMSPNEWGWKTIEKHFSPIATDKDPAPPDVLNMISCKCKLSSKSPCYTNRCTCRSNGINCIAACGECHGDGCHNARVTTDIYLTDDSDSDVDKNVDTIDATVSDLFS